jgi:hypothetical protein
MTAPRVTIDQLPLASIVTTDDVAIVEGGATTKRINVITGLLQPAIALIDNHLASVPAHAATAIQATPSGTLTAGTVQGQLNQVAATLATIPSGSALVGVTSPTKTALGVTAGAGVSGSNNVAIGDGALSAGTFNGSFAVAIGSNAMQKVTGSAGQVGVAVGALAMQNTTTGGGEAIGNGALQNQTTGINTALGVSTGGQVTTALNNVFIGTNADLKDTTQSTGTLALGPLARTKGDYAVALGFGAEATATESMAIGHNVTTAVANEIKIGRVDQTVNIPGTLSVATVITTPTAWTAVTFQNSWVDFGAGLQICQYRKVGDEVQVRGVIQGGVSATVAFTLPTGFRPLAGFSAAAVGPSASMAVVTVNTTGTVAVISAGGTSPVHILFRFSVTA